MADTYVKKLTIVPNLDLSALRKSIADIPQALNDAVNTMKTKAQEIGQAMSQSIEKAKNKIISPSFKKAMSEAALGFSSNFQKSLFDGATTLSTQLKEIDVQLSKIEKERKALEKAKSLTVSDFSNQDEYDAFMESIDGDIKNLASKKTNLQKQKFNLQNSKQGESFGKNLGSFLGKGIKDGFKPIIDNFKNFLETRFKIISDSIKELKNMSQYSLSTTYTVNRSIRDQMLMYGLSEAQNYAFDRVKKEMGITGFDDLALLTPVQQERFAERIGYFSGKYEELANRDFFRKYEEYVASMNDFKEELRMSIIQFIVDNKDTIIAVMNFLMKALEFIMKTIQGISNLLRVNPTETLSNAAVSDIINNNSNTSKVTTVKVDNSFNGISLKDQSSISNAVQRANEQLIQALNGNL